MQQTRCINCLKIITPDTKNCPYCGYGQQAEQPYYALRMHTILKGRYLTGRVIDKGMFGITYTGLDLKSEQRVAIREFYPSDTDIASRDNGSNRIIWGKGDNRSNWVIWGRGEGFITPPERRPAGYADECIERIFKQVCQAVHISDAPAIVRIRDAFRENETACIVTEFINGKTLKDWICQNGSMTWKTCKQMLFPMMDGIARAHDQHIVHGDISPNSILVQADGNAKLKGIEEPVQVKDAITAKLDDHSGLPMDWYNPFKAFEQCHTEGPVGPWTDVYAFSSVLIYCVTGKTVPCCMFCLSKAETAPDEMLKETAGIPTGVKEVLLDALQKQKENRIQSMKEFRERLEQAEFS